MTAASRRTRAGSFRLSRPAFPLLFALIGAPAAEASSSASAETRPRAGHHAGLHAEATDYRLLPHTAPAPLLPPLLLAAPLQRKVPWLQPPRYRLVPVPMPLPGVNGDRVPKDVFAASLLRVNGVPAPHAKPVIGLSTRFNGGASKLSVAPRANGFRIRFSHDY